VEIKIYQVDAFTNEVFSGNPAAVCPLEQWLDDNIMQKIAMENNLAETAFIIKTSSGYNIRWFTPTVEVDLCGHATLAAAHVLFEHENYQGSKIDFFSPRSGNLTVVKEENHLTLNFPTDKLIEVPISPQLNSCFQIEANEAYKGKTDYILVFGSETEIKALKPNLKNISDLDARGLVVTAKGDACDFVSRFFGPQSGIDEDPVTGSAHTSLTPIWAKKLNKSKLSAVQLSERKGWLMCKDLQDRVEISGSAKLYLKGTIYLP
tara:strand:- start:4033 stop:4821 length:789 start_codon:yes stop_codon:yes gene_type:complete